MMFHFGYLLCIFCGWQTHINYNIGGFLLEAKASWGHTGRAGGLFCRYTIIKGEGSVVTFSLNFLYLLAFKILALSNQMYSLYVYKQH